MPVKANARMPAPAPKARRASYDLAFKEHVVRTALLRPQNNRIKPTCALFPGIEPCQVRAERARLTPEKDRFAAPACQRTCQAARAPRVARPAPAIPGGLLRCCALAGE